MRKVTVEELQRVLDTYDHGVLRAGKRGYRDPGWYFWDETSVYVCGPYDTKQVAETQLDAYCKFLAEEFHRGED